MPLIYLARKKQFSAVPPNAKHNLSWMKSGWTLGYGFSPGAVHPDPWFHFPMTILCKNWSLCLCDIQCWTRRWNTTLHRNFSLNLKCSLRTWGANFYINPRICGGWRRSYDCNQYSWPILELFVFEVSLVFRWLSCHVRSSNSDG